MRVGVVGAGITGLTLTHRLAARGVDVVTFEAASEPGGVMRSTSVDGRLLEHGPQRVRLTDGVADLVDDVGLRDRLLTADEDLPLYVYANGDLGEVPRSLRAFARTDLLSWRGKLRLLAEPLTDEADPDETAAEVFRRKFGREAYENVIEPLYGGIYGSDPEEMPADHALTTLMALENRKGSLLRAALERVVGDGDTPPPISFEEGLQALPRALYGAHSPYVHLDAPVDHVAGDDAFVIHADSRAVDVDRVVVTVPGPAAAGVLSDLDGATVEPLRDLTYNSLVLVHLAADVDAAGFGYQVRRDEPLETLGVSWNASIFDRDGVYTAFLGGMHDPGAVQRAPADLGETARREFESVMDAEASVLDVTKLPRVMPAYDDTWRGLDDVRLPNGVELATNYTARMGVPGRVREATRVATEIASDVDGDGPPAR